MQLPLPYRRRRRKGGTLQALLHLLVGDRFLRRQGRCQGASRLHGKPRWRELGASGTRAGRIPGAKRNNLLDCGECNYFFKDTNPNCPPDERYKATTAVPGPKGVTLRSCELFGDRVDRKVRLEGGDLTVLRGECVTLEFALLDADLYSYRFAD